MNTNPQSTLHGKEILSCLNAFYIKGKQQVSLLLPGQRLAVLPQVNP